MHARCLIEIVSQHPNPPQLDHDLIQRAIDLTVENEVPLSTVTILLVDSFESARLHGEHFNDPIPTDVMTFPDGSHDPEQERIHLGDLAVCVDVAREMACTNNCTQAEMERIASQECLLYMVHGVLHLLGFDDCTDEDRTEMWQRQQTILAQLGIQVDDDE